MIKIKLQGLLLLVVVSCFILCHYVSAQGNPDNGEDGEFNQRVVALQNTLKANPSDIKSRMELGNLFLLRGEYNSASKQFRDVVDRNSAFLPAYFSLAVALQKKDKPDYSRAQMVLRKALKIAPQNASVYLNMGYLSIAQARPQKALKEFQEVLKLTNNPTVLASAHLGMASVYQGQKDNARAEIEYSEVFKIDPGLRDVLIDLESKKAGEEQKSELPLGRIVDFIITQQFSVLNNPRLNESIALIAGKLAKNSNNPHLKLTVKVLNAPDTINTFCAPGGFIYVTTGTLDFIDNNIIENERKDVLAFLLAHEIGHVSKKHGLQRLKRMELLNKIQIPLIEIGLVGLSGLAGVTVEGSNNAITSQLILEGSSQLSPMLLVAGTGAVFDLVCKGYSRSEEFEADGAAFKCVEKSGYKVGAVITFFNKLRESKEYKEKIPKLKFFSTHPSLGKRIVNIEQFAHADKK